MGHFDVTTYYIYKDKVCDIYIYIVHFPFYYYCFYFYEYFALFLIIISHLLPIRM